MNVLWHKVWFDLWQNKTRTLLAVLSMAVGVFSIGAIFGLVDQLLTNMDAAHQAVIPSHINIFLRNNIDLETAVGLESVPGVSGIEPANQLSIRFKKVGAEKWEPAILMMRDDYTDQTYDLLQLRAGDWPSDRQFGVERLTGQSFDIEMGDTIIFDIGNGTERAFPVNTMIRHPFVQPPDFGGPAHFFTDAEGLARFGIPEGAYRQLLVQVEPYSLEHAQDVAGEIRSRLGKQGVNVSVTFYQEPEAHWGRPFVEGFTLVLRFMAVVSLFLSVILVVNTLTAVITQQTNQIGVIKAVGGKSGTIMQIYLAGVLVYGMLAFFISLPLGAWLAFYGSSWFLNIFNISYDQFQLSPRALMWQVVAALIVPLIAAFWPVMQGATISVRAALATYGIGKDFGGSKIDLLVEQIGERLLPPPYPVALGNLFRRKARLLLTLSVLTIAGVMFLVVMTLVSSTNLTLDNDMNRRGYDLRFGFTRSQRTERVLAMTTAVPGITSAETWYTANATILREGERLNDSAGLGAQLTGVPVDSVMQVPLIIDGRWMQPGDDRVVVVKEETAVDNQIAVGDVVRLDLGDLGADEWTVIGLYKDVYEAGFTVEEFYAPLTAVADVTKQANRATQLLVKTNVNSLAANLAIAESLKTLFEDREMDTSPYVNAVKLEERDTLNAQFAPVQLMFINLAFLMGAVGGIGLMGALGISVVERRREIGVLRAVGAKSPTIMGLFMMEGVLQGVISWVLSVPISVVVAKPLSQLLGETMIGVALDYGYAVTAVFAWLIIIIIIALVASYFPARNASRISVRESLAYG